MVPSLRCSHSPHDVAAPKKKARSSERGQETRVWKFAINVEANRYPSLPGGEGYRGRDNSSCASEEKILASFGEDCNEPRPWWWSAMALAVPME